MRHIVRERVVPPAEIVAGYRSLLSGYSPSCVVADCMERDGVLPSALRAASPGRFAGPAVTVRLAPGDLVDALEVLEVAQKGDVIVVDAGGDTETSVWGGLMTGLSQRLGIVGAVVDGAVRDVDEVREMRFPLVSRAIVPRSTHSPYSHRYEPLEINVDLAIGGVVVRPGDLVLADEIGVVVVPRGDSAAVLERAQAQMAQEERTRQRIREGKSLADLLAEFGRL